MSQQQITVMWVPGAEDGTVTRVISVPMFNSTIFGRAGGSSTSANVPYHTYNIPVPDTAKVTWLSKARARSGGVVSPNVFQKTVSTASAFRFSKANALVAAIISDLNTTGSTPNPSLLYGPSVSLTGATKIFDGRGITISTTQYFTAIPTITNVQLPNKYLLFTATGSEGALDACVVIEDDNPIRA